MTISLNKRIARAAALVTAAAAKLGSLVDFDRDYGEQQIALSATGLQGMLHSLTAIADDLLSLIDYEDYSPEAEDDNESQDPGRPA